MRLACNGCEGGSNGFAPMDHTSSRHGVNTGLDLMFTFFKSYVAVSK
jgi:hypothetical protein